AAMAATPRWLTLALSLPGVDEAWIGAFADGLFALAARFGVELIGGDTVRGPRSICICILGEVPEGQALRRDGARPGDDVWVSGELGGAALALAQPGIAEAERRLHEPEPRVALGERLRGRASAAIDVSDGFAQDLGHILERSGCGARVQYERLPKCAAFARIAQPRLERKYVLSGGDDYELVFTAPQAARAAIDDVAREIGVPLARVGAIHAGAPTLSIADGQGNEIPIARGFDHFSA
ncbi:MAG TPA: thiamine-phosphate kinase, partial [Burkholderiales bacterium]|nr:thiamine-phosphate kinase [Burkholderiales bacterium]